MDIKKVQRPAQVAAQPQRQAASAPTPTSLPSSGKPKRRPISKVAKRSLWAIAITIFVIITISVVYFFMSPRLQSEPSFQAILPAKKSIRELGGWTRVSPPEQAPAFSYDDAINDIAIKVTQQELQNASQSVADIAKAYNATDKITASDTAVYIGTSFNGPQSVLFAKGNLLILIASADKISNDSWASYINALH